MSVPEGKVAVVTGGAHGIGKATADALPPAGRVGKVEDIVYTR